jgi:hypothetical protein
MSLTSFRLTTIPMKLSPNGAPDSLPAILLPRQKGETMAWQSAQTIHRSIAATVLMLIAGWAHAQTATVTPGGAIRVPLGRGIVLNKESSIERIWITVQDSVMPVEFKNVAGIKTNHTFRGDIGEYEYSAVVQLTARQPISAIEVRFMLFDIWGQSSRNLVVTEILDLAPGTTKELNPKWRISSEGEAAQHYASIAYISRVRTKDGKVFAANGEFIIDQARKFSAQFKEVDPEPNK